MKRKDLLKSIPFKPKNSTTEANIQAELYHRLKILNINSYLEYTVDDCRFDIVVLDNKRENILLIIECKKEEIKQTNSKTDQLIKYRRYNIPIMVVSCDKEIDKATEIIQSVMIDKDRNGYLFRDYANKNGVIFLFTRLDPNKEVIEIEPKVIRYKQRELSEQSSEFRQYVFELMATISKCDIKDRFINSVIKYYKRNGTITEKQFYATRIIAMNNNKFISLYGITDKIK